MPIVSVESDGFPTVGQAFIKLAKALNEGLAAAPLFGPASTVAAFCAIGVAVTVPADVTALLGVAESIIPSPVNVRLCNVPAPEAVWQAPSAPRYCDPEHALKRFTISKAPAGVTFDEEVNLGMFPETGAPDAVRVPDEHDPHVGVAPDPAESRH